MRRKNEERKLRNRVFLDGSGCVGGEIEDLFLRFLARGRIFGLFYFFWTAAVIKMG